MSDIQPHNQPFPSLTHIVMLPLLTLCPNRNYTRICPVTNRCVGDDSRFQTYYHEAFRLRLCLQRNHPCGLFSSYMIPVCIYFHFPCELCCGGDEQAEKMFVGKVHSFEQRAVDIKQVRQSSLLSFEHNLNANICKLSPTSHGFEI